MLGIERIQAYIIPCFEVESIYPIFERESCNSHPNIIPPNIIYKNCCILVQRATAAATGALNPALLTSRAKNKASQPRCVTRVIFQSVFHGDVVSWNVTVESSIPSG